MSTFTALSADLLATASLARTPAKPKDRTLTPTIAALALHPSLESILHLLNHDLPSAHFLLRHMQAPPALEGMLLHGILHRIEGDFRNAEAWISDVGDACAGWVPKKRDEGEKLDGGVMEKCGCKGLEGRLVEFVYGAEGAEGAKALVEDVERLRKRKSGESEEGRLEERSREEMGRVMEWCAKKFGTQMCSDASSAWVKNSEDVQKISNDMVSGGKGHRQF